MIYRSKVDSGAPTVLITLIGCQFATGLILLIGLGATNFLGWFVLIVVSPILPLVVLLFAWPMTYDPGATRSDGEPILLVRGGLLLRYEVPIAGIREVRPSKSVRSSMSWSYDRIEVISTSPKGFPSPLLISPRDREAFLDDLAKRARDLVRVGDRLTRRQDTHSSR
jgi:Bacterial PH domain